MNALQQLKALLAQEKNRAKPALMPAPVPPAPVLTEPANDPAMELQDWHALHLAYMTHAIQCPTCKAAGKGTRYGQRCTTGISLWRDYEACPCPHFTQPEKGHKP